MGFAIAEALAKEGALVDLIAGPVPLKTEHPNIFRHDVVSAEEMYHLCLQIFPKTDGAIMAAAVSDYSPVEVVTSKIKHSEAHRNIELKPNPDIAAKMGTIKQAHQILAGFALETDDEELNATKKMQKKNFDFIVLNSLKTEGAGFGTDTNKITIINRQNKKTDYPLKSKRHVANDIINYLVPLLTK
jgi:phosphopantothenoylcysteine decarboxylase/phosphopantothenate--cysteine ligase